MKYIAIFVICVVTAYSCYTDKLSQDGKNNPCSRCPDLELIYSNIFPRGEHGSSHGEHVKTYDMDVLEKRRNTHILDDESDDNVILIEKMISHASMKMDITIWFIIIWFVAFL